MLKPSLLARMLTALATTLLVSAVPVAAREQVPFKASYTGTIAFTAPGMANIDGSGRATHLGRSELAGPSAIVGRPPCGGATTESHFALTAANGDQVNVTLIDDDCPTDTPGVFTTTGTYTVTGGTGRFDGASGTGDVIGTVDLNELAFQLDLSGTISSRGSR